MRQRYCQKPKSIKLGIVNHSLLSSTDQQERIINFTTMFMLLKSYGKLNAGDILPISVKCVHGFWRNNYTVQGILKFVFSNPLLIENIVPFLTVAGEYIPTLNS